MLIKAKYLTAIILLVLFCSTLIYEITGGSNSFVFILASIAVGSTLGMATYCAAVHYGSKVMSKFFKDV
jgi:hypothetical protein